MSKNTKQAAKTEVVRTGITNHTTALDGELMPSTEPAARPKHDIAKVLDKFLSAIDDYRDALNTAMPAIVKKRNDEAKKTLSKLEKFTVENDGEITLVARGAHAAREMIETAREADRLHASRIFEIMSKCFFIGLFSEYDAFIGALLNAIYNEKPSLFKEIKREISLSDILAFNGLEAVKQDMLEKEIDSFRRDSYIDQFSNLEKKFNIRLKDFTEWPDFVEMSQRRNLMTHNGGCVSQQYLMICQKEKVSLDQRLSAGQELELPADYLSNVLFVMSKVAFMLTHTLWRKVLPEQVRVADNAFNDSIYDLLYRKRWRYAAEFGKFGLSEPISKNLQDVSAKIRIINTAIGLKHQGKNDEALKLINQIDWSASTRDFQLACAVLKEEYKEAAGIMKKIGMEGELVNQLGYHTWPLFEGFRGIPEFLDAYKSIYKTDFISEAKRDAEASSGLLRKDLRQQKINAKNTSKPKSQHK